MSASKFQLLLQANAGGPQKEGGGRVEGRVVVGFGGVGFCCSVEGDRGKLGGGLG